MSIIKFDTIDAEALERAGKIGRVGITARAHQLKREAILKTPNGDEFPEGVMACMERARYYTKAYKGTEGEPECIRRATAFANALDNMTIFIKDKELIVGYCASKPEYLPLWPELSNKCNQEVLKEPYLTDEQKEEFREYVEYWTPRTLQSRTERLLTKEEIDVVSTGAILGNGTFQSGYTSPSPGMKNIIDNGLEKIMAGIQEKLDAATERIHKSPAFGPEEIALVKSCEEWKAMLIADKAVLRWTKRYSQLASVMAERESDPVRKAELEEIARIALKVPAKPAEHFWEALQCIWYVTICYHQVERLSSGCPYRVDQVPYKMFERDVLIDKTMTRDQAQELVEVMRIKYNELGAYRASMARRVNQGAGMTLIWTLGGVKEDGSDACNELTNVLIDACRSIRTNQPSLALRYHPNTSLKTMEHAFRCIRAGLSMPSFHSDEYAIKQLMANGASLAEARDWGLVLCQSPGCQGSKGTRVRNAYDIMPAKCLELALADGYDYFFAKKQAGLHTGDPTKFTSFDDVWNAFCEQMKYAINIGSRQKIMTRIVEAEWLKQPFLSSMWEQCVERGVDGIEWEEIANPWFNLIGLVDAADSMSSLNKLVFIDKKYTMEEVITALRANWEGYEDMRKDFENVPKYGNDDDYADSFMGKILDWTTAYARGISNYAGGHPRPLPQAVSGFWAYGIKTGALPNGRHEGDVIADGGCSPYHSYDKNGPTAVIASASKFNHEQLKGCLLNQRLNQAQLMAEGGFELFNSYVAGAFASGISQIQFNVVDNKVLRAAQKEPEQYPDLVVRVAGYSAYFTELNRKTQDGIISRTEQKFA